MGLKEVLDEILDNANDESAKIQDEGKKEAKAILVNAKKKVGEKRALSEKELANVLLPLEQKEIASAKLMNKRAILNAKKEVIDCAYEKAVCRIKNLDIKTREKILANLLKKASIAISSPKYVYANKDDAKIVKGLARNLEYKEAEIMGGFILEDTTRQIRINCSFDSLLASFMEDRMREVSDKLF